MTRLLALVPVLLVVVGCGDDGGSVKAAADPTAPRTIAVTSPAFAEGQAIPSRYTCHGEGTSPPLQWSGVDGDTVGSLALVVDDPDAPGGDYVHWIVLGIPNGHGALDAGVLPEEAHEVDGSGGAGWHPPCPPSGTHHYRFTLYAFPADETSALEGDASLESVLAWLSQDAVAWGRLTGTVTASGGNAGGGY